MRRATETAAAWIDALNLAVGRAVSWLLLLMTLVTCLIVLLAAGFNSGWIWLQESVTYMHGILIMCGCSYTLLADEHVRIDIFYSKLGSRGKAVTNLLGSLILLIPACAVIFALSWDYVLRSWKIMEGSYESGGIPASFLLKSFLLVFAALTLLQGISCSLRCALTLLAGRKADNK